MKETKEEFLMFIEQEIEPKGLSKQQKIDENKLKTRFFSDEFSLFNQLQEINLDFQQKPTLFYPGSGSDILSPLLYIEKLLPNLIEIDFKFVDITNSLGLIKTILDDIGVHFTEIDNGIKFYWRNTLINLEFHKADVFSSLAEVSDYDIYFEKRFRIMKEQDLTYEYRAFSKLKQNGILISDCGFAKFQLENKLTKISVPKELSIYGSMIVGIKN